MNYREAELKLVKLVLTYPNLREQYVSLGFSDYVSSSVSKILTRILDLSYFKDLPVDKVFVCKNSSDLGLPSLELDILFSELENIIVQEDEFWVVVDVLKNELIKGTMIPVLVDEYQRLLSSKTEFSAREALQKIRDKITVIFGEHAIGSKTDEDLNDIEERIKVYTGEKENDQIRFLTGYEMDSFMGGFATSELIVFMGASGVGKTTLLLNLGYQVWDVSNANVHFYSLEMPVHQVLRRIDSRILQINSIDLRSGRYGTPNKEVIERVKSKENVFKVFDIPPYTSINQIEENLVRSQVKPDVIIVDYIGLMGGKSRKPGNRWEVLDEVAISLKYLAKRYKVCVITASQISSDASRRMDQNTNVNTEGYQLYDIAGAKSIGNHADVVCGIQYNDITQIMDFSSPKARDMASFRFQMFLNREICHLYDIQ